MLSPFFRKGDDKMAKKKANIEEPSKKFNDTFRSLCGRHSGYDVWRDFVTSFACLISMSFTPEHFAVRKERYEKIRSRYNEQELPLMDLLYGTTLEVIAKNPDQDFLGATYMSLNYGNKNCGQYFTPYHVSKMMAKMTGTGDEDIEKKGYVTVSDPCCGSGGLLVAYANVLREKHKDIAPIALFEAQDIDNTVSMMCYIQLSLNDCAGYVTVGNSLTNPVPDLESESTWVTPMMYHPVWIARFNEAYEKIKKKDEEAA